MKLVMLVCLVYPAQWDHLDQLLPRNSTRAFPDRTVKMACLVRQEKEVPMDYLDCQGSQDPKASQEYLENEGLLAFQDSQAFKESLV